MKKLMTLGLLATTLAFADGAPSDEVASLLKAPKMTECEPEAVKASFGYVNLGLGPFPIPCPLFGVGGRYQNGHNGFDGSLQFISFGSEFTLLKENFDYLYYPKPNLDSQFYVGAGAAVTELISGGRVNVALSPQVILGKQYTNKAGDVRYFQAQIDPVFFDMNAAIKKNKVRWGAYPAVVLQYGICF